MPELGLRDILYRGMDKPRIKVKGMEYHGTLGLHWPSIHYIDYWSISAPSSELVRALSLRFQKRHVGNNSHGLLLP